MVRIGYHASHEQFPPSKLLKWSQAAVDAGFDAIFSSDHFHPWTTHESNCGFSWSWMGAALQATSVPGRLICCPFGRYHPAVIAQAAATLAEMFPGRFALAIGSGELLNEGITGSKWPDKQERNQLLQESAEIIKALWRGEEVTTSGPLKVKQARLFTLPEEPPLLLAAALGEETARLVAPWADGLVMVSTPRDGTRKMIDAFREAGGDTKPMFLKVGLAYSKLNDEDALNQAHQQWKNLAFPSSVLSELATPNQFDALGEKVEPKDLLDSLRVSAEMDRHFDWLQNDIELGFEEIYLHNVNANQEEFIESFGLHVLPGLRKTESVETGG